MYQAKVTIGVLPTRRGMLDVNVAIQEKKKCMEIISGILPDVVRLVTIDDVVENGIIDHESKSPAAVAKFQEEKVDAIFVQFCDFGDEGSVASPSFRFPSWFGANGTSIPTLSRGGAGTPSVACSRPPRYCAATV